MTSSRHPDRLVQAFLDEGPIELSDRTVEFVLGEIHRTRQRATFGSRRTLFMSRTALAAMVTAVAVSVSGLALWVTRPTIPSIAAPSAAPIPSAVASPPMTASPPAASATPGATAPAIGNIPFARWDATPRGYHLYVVPAGGGAPSQLAPRASCCLTVSADGRTLVYGVTAPDGRIVPASRFLPESGPASLFDSPAGLNLRPGAFSSLLDLAFEGWDGSDPARTGIYLSIDNGGGLIWGTFKRLTTTKGSLRDVPLAFSPDGSKLLFARGTPGSEDGDLYVIGIDGTGIHRLNPPSITVGHSDLFGSGASWSPDSQRVAFSGYGGDGCTSATIYVVSVADATAQAIVHPDGCATSARWSPDGSWIAFQRATNPGGGHDVWLVHPDGTGPINLTDALPTGVCCGQWSPDGSQMVVQGGDASTSSVDLWIVNADGSGSRQLTTEPSLYAWYLWSPAP
jgi:dipeptidyl aminopeptidase/acylaminoacyl peptidase